MTSCSRLSRKYWAVLNRAQSFSNLDGQFSPPVCCIKKNYFFFFSFIQSPYVKKMYVWMLLWSLTKICAFSHIFFFVFFLLQNFCVLLSVSSYKQYSAFKFSLAAGQWFRPLKWCCANTRARITQNAKGFMRGNKIFSGERKKKKKKKLRENASFFARKR